MHTQRYLIATLCCMLSTMLSAQVMHVYCNDQNNYKEYIENYDSIVFVPETDYSLNVGAAEFYVSENKEVHTKIKVTTGPQTSVVRALLTAEGYSDQMMADIYRGTKDGCKTLVTGTRTEVDFIIPDPKKTYMLYIVSGTNRYTKVVTSASGEDQLTNTEQHKQVIKYDADALNWSEWYSTKAEWLEAGNSPTAWPLSESERTCSYTNAVLNHEVMSDLPISYRVNRNNLSKGQFLISNWGGATRQLIIDYDTNSHNCIIYPQQVSPASGEDQWVRDVDQWQGATGGFYGSFPCKYDPRTGIFTLSLQYYTSGGGNFGFATETCKVDGFYVADYALEATYSRLYTDETKNDYAVVNVSKIGTDITKLLATVISTEYDAEAVADAIVDGDLDSEELHLGENYLLVGDEYDDRMQVVICAMANGKLVGMQNLVFEYFHNGLTPWISLGKGEYTEGLVSDMYGLPVSVYEVEIQEHSNKPGLYRLIDPYGANWPYKASNKMKPCEYLEINACDPNAVYILPQMLGVDIEGGIELGMASYGGHYLNNGNDFATLKAEGYFGTLKDGVITLPNRSSNADVSMGVCYYGSKTYPSLCDFKVVLPAAMNHAKKRIAKTSAPSEEAILLMLQMTKMKHRKTTNNEQIREANHQETIAPSK